MPSDNVNGTPSAGISSYKTNAIGLEASGFQFIAGLQMVEKDNVPAWPDYQFRTSDIKNRQTQQPANTPAHRRTWQYWKRNRK
jgi:hypothetical protein